MIENLAKRLKRPQKVNVYSQVAFFYDQLMDHVDYPEWAEYIDILLQQYGSDVQHVVDGGCGTGRMIEAMRKFNYKMVGFDLSYSMIHLASKRFQHVSLWQGDLQSLALHGGWDAFICLYDTIHYLSLDMLEQMLLQIYQSLKMRGIFVFDAVTKSHVIRCWADYTEFNQYKGKQYTRRSWYDPQKHCQNTEFEVHIRSTGQVFFEHHIQWMFSLEKLQMLIKKCGFHLVGLFDGLTRNPGDEQSDRVHFVLRKDKA